MNPDLLVVIEANKRMYWVWSLLILLCKLDIKVARDLSEPQVVKYVHRLCANILMKVPDGS